MVAIRIEALQKTLADKEREFRLAVPFFSVSGGERKAIVGSTGSGKTTVMDILAMVTEPDDCRRFELDNGEDLIDLSAISGRRSALAQLRAAYFGYITQQSPLFPFLTVAENVAVQQKVSRRPDRAYAEQLAGMLGIDMLLSARPAELSVGQRQRAAIARSLSHRPYVVLCDEPTGALDPVTARQAISTILWAADQTGAAVVMITHDWELASEFKFEFHVIETKRHEGSATINVLRPLDAAAREVGR
jgi:putative ABC transport system ATP-binding protein